MCVIKLIWKNPIGLRGKCWSIEIKYRRGQGEKERYLVKGNES